LLAGIGPISSGGTGLLVGEKNPFPGLKRFYRGTFVCLAKKRRTTGWVSVADQRQFLLA
jgi:hypothetical protein